jgi:hypothetical protein
MVTDPTRRLQPRASTGEARLTQSSASSTALPIPHSFQSAEARLLRRPNSKRSGNKKPPGGGCSIYVFGGYG